MSIEVQIAALTSAIVGLTGAINKGGASAPATAPAEPAAPKAPAKAAKAAAAKSGKSKAEMQAALNEVKEKIDTAAAKAIIKAAGFDRMADITDDKFDEIYEAAKAKMAEHEGGAVAGDDDI